MMFTPRTRRALRRTLRRQLLPKLGVVLFGLLVVGALCAPLLAPHDPTTQQLDEKLRPPIGFSGQTEQTSSQLVDGEVKTVTETTTISATWTHPLGTDALGRDMLSRVLYGARTSLLVGLLGTTVAAIIGVPTGLIAGYYGGRIDDALMRSGDVMLAFPSLVLAVALVGLFGTATVRIPDPWVVLGITPAMPAHVVLPGTVVLVVGLVNWVWLARIARGEAMGLANAPYVLAARSVGASDRFILRRHVLPNALTPILVLATIQVATIILLESALAFLGFTGTTLSWGFDVSQGRDLLSTAWWVTTIPGFAIVFAVFAVNLIGDWFRDALDPGIDADGGGGP